MPNDNRADAVFDQVAALPAVDLAGYLQGEAPQMAATLLLRFPPAAAAKALTGMTEDFRRRVLGRMATTGSAAPALIGLMAETMRLDLLAVPGVAHRAKTRLSDILAALPPEARIADTGTTVTQPRTGVAPKEAAPPAIVHSGAAPRLSPGLAAMLNSRNVIRDRMPMLEVALDRHVRLLSTRLRALCGRTAEASLSRLSSVRFGDWMNDVALSATSPSPLFAVVRSPNWHHYGVMLVDEAARESVTEAALGGGAGCTADRIVSRSPTSLDRAALTLLVGEFLDALNVAFEPIACPDFRLERIEDNARFATIDRPQNAALLVDLDIRMEGGGGRIALLLPYALLEPVRGVLTRPFTGERFGKDPRWSAHLRAAVPQSRVRLNAVAGPAMVTLGAALAWRSNNLVRLGIGTESNVTLVAGGAVVGQGRLEQRGGRLTVTPRNAVDDGGDKTMTDDITRTAAVTGAEPFVDGPTALHRVKLRLSAVVGGADMTVEELLHLGRGAVIELDRRVGELIDVTVNDQIVAKGELVLVEDRLAVSLLEIVGAPD